MFYRGKLALLGAGVSLLVFGCSGGHHESAVSPGVAPVIANLSLPSKAVPIDSHGSELPIRFDFNDPDADIRQVSVSIDTQGAAVNDLPDALGRTQGSASLEQAILAGPSGHAAVVTVQVIDGKGNRSNALTGAFVYP